MYLKGKIMNTLELNAMGLAPMTEVEMQEVDGGWFLLAIAATILICFGIGYMIGEMRCGR